jgi:hypothetical protein
MTQRQGDFDLRALYEALDEQRRSRDLTWAALSAEVSRHRTRLRPIAASTITSLKDKRVAEGDGVLQMLLWLERTPESFVRGIPDAGAPHFRLPPLTRGQILRWNTRALHVALDARRREQRLTWTEVAREVGGFTPGMLAKLESGPRIGFPRVMRLVRWLGTPAVAFTRIAQW